jgi:hypothetical protein
MRTASTDFIAAATTDYARYYGKFTVGETEYTVPLTDLKVTASENGSSDLTIGNAQSSSITFSIYEYTIDLENREMVLFEGLEVSDGNIEYIQIGIFKITSATAEEGKTSYTGYDRMYSSMEMTYVSKLKYPNEDINIVKEICTQAGITFVESTMDDKTITIATAPKGYTRREMLGYLSARQGKNAVINSQGQLEFRWYKDADYTIRPTKYYENGLKFTTSKAFKVEKIVCEVATDDDSKTLTSGSGTMAINISNPFMTQAVLDAVYKKVGGFTYRPLTVECLGDWRLEVGDIVKVTSDGVKYSAPITSIVYDCDGGLKCSIESCGQSDTNNSINPTGPITSQMQRLTAELITANQVIATKISAEQADIKYATIENLNALSGKFDTLSAKAITTDNLAAATAKLGYMTAEQADIKYANIELTNIDTANVATLFANVGLIDRATVVEGHITGFLDSVEVNANKITAGTLVADRILLKGSESGLLYALNNLGKLTSTTVDSLDGYVLTDRTINADKIVANSITANELDVANIFADNAVISTITSQEAFINAISTNSVVVGIKNTVDNLSVGDRNLLLATKDFGKISTSNGDWAMSTDNDGFTVAARTGSGNWNAIRTITNIDATNNAQSDKQVVITIDAKADDLATSPANYLIACEIYGSNDGFKTWTRQIYTNDYFNGGTNLKYLGGTRVNNEWCTLSFTLTLDKLKSGSWGTYNEYRYGVAVSTTNNNTSHTLSVRKFKMSFGNVPSDWSPNPDDISVENIYTTGTTTIDGGKITTGSITADKISVDDLSAITAKIGSWSITTNKIYAGDAETGTAVMQRPTVNTKWVFASGGKDHTNYGDCPFRVDKEGNFYSTSGTIGGFTIGADYLRTKADSRGYKFGMSSNARPTGICSYIGKEGSDTDYVYAVHWNGEVETSKITAGGAVFGGGRVYFNGTEKAYLTKGDSVPIVFSTGGYITGGGKIVCFFLPTRLIIGASTATLSFTASEGIKVRQGGKYCYGSTADTNVRPASQSISLSGEAGVNVQLTMSNSTNAINNDACGVALTGTLKLS